MVKIKVCYKEHCRTFYTRKDWKNGQKLYAYYYKPKRMTGNWYNDPGYDHMSWQDYEREYARQCRGEKEPDPQWLIEMKALVANHNDLLIDMANAGVKRVKFNENGVLVTES